MKSDYLVFEVTFGPGKLGIKMKCRKQLLAEGESETEVVYLENVPDEDITIVGPGKRVPLLRKEPVILAVNGKSTTSMNLKQVVQILGDAARPLTLRLQIGVAPQKPRANLYASLSVTSMPDLSQIPESPIADEQSSPEDSPLSKPMNDILPASPLELSLDDGILSPVVSLRRSLSPRSFSPTNGMEGRKVRRYYQRNYRNTPIESEAQEEVEEEEKEEKEDEKKEEKSPEAKQRLFVEHMRIYFLLEMCDLLDGYDQFIRRVISSSDWFY